VQNHILIWHFIEVIKKRLPKIAACKNCIKQ